jgi:hypothetical protein
MPDPKASTTPTAARKKTGQKSGQFVARAQTGSQELRGQLDSKIAGSAIR